MNQLTNTLIHRLRSKGMESALIPGYIRCLSNSFHLGPNMTLLQVKNRLKYMGWDDFDLDYFTSVATAREKMGPDQILLGNIDPVRDLRNSSPERVKAAIAQCHVEAGERYIVGAGCEMPRDTPLANVRALTDYARCWAC